MPASTSRRKPECRPISIRAHQRNALKIELSWADAPKKTTSATSDTRQFSFLSWWKRQRRRTYLQSPQSASWLQPTVWLPERICVSQRGLNADSLNLLLFLPDRAIFSRWSVGTIAIRAQLGSLTPTFMLIFSATRTLCSNLATLARVAKLVAVETSSTLSVSCQSN